LCVAVVVVVVLIHSTSFQTKPKIEEHAAAAAKRLQLYFHRSVKKKVNNKRNVNGKKKMFLRLFRSQHEKEKQLDDDD